MERELEERLAGEIPLQATEQELVDSREISPGEYGFHIRKG